MLRHPHGFEARGVPPRLCHGAAPARLGMAFARERILAENDRERLERWSEKAVVAASIAEVIDDPN